MSDTTTSTGRPPLPRYRADLVIAIEFGAPGDIDAAEERLAALVDQLRPRLEAMVRNTRKGAPEVLTVEGYDPSAV